MSAYKYIGDGAGVPGLPHEIPESEAAQYGEALQAAIAAGLYKLESVALSGATLSLSKGSADEAPKRKSKASEPAEGD